MGQFRQLVGSGATYLNGFAQNIGISIIQRSDLLTFMIDNRFKHAIFGIFQHRLHTRDISLEALI